MALSNEEMILDKLEQILKVLALQVGNDRSTTERVHLLRVAGLDYATISEVLETPVNTIRVLASQYKAKRRKK